MSEAERSRMRAKLDEFSLRLDARAREFQERGDFLDVHQSLMTQIRRRHDQLQSKLVAAEANGTAWEVIKIEFERDLSSMYGDLLKLEEQSDADAMKRDDP
jgi:hypothetical protein